MVTAKKNLSAVGVQRPVFPFRQLLNPVRSILSYVSFMSFRSSKLRRKHP